MEFLIWHTISILGLCMMFFAIGYRTAQKHLDRKEQNG
jgi:hypothetical protein